MTKEIITKPFQEAHLSVFDCLPEYLASCRESAKLMDDLGRLGQCGSQTVDGRILYVAAWYAVVPGVVEVFVFPSVYVPDYGMAFYRHVKWWLKHLLSEPETRRLQTWGQDTERSAKWLASLGFRREGVLYSYGQNGENVCIWGMVKCKQ